VKICPRCSEICPEDALRCPRDGAELRTISDPYVGKTVGGRYRIIERLGSGGMSSVYLAKHVLIDRLVAVKTLRRDLAADPVQRDRFLREARAVNRINHQNIVEITDYGESEDGLVYLVMEYVPGESLLQAMVEAPFPPLRALHIVEQAAMALGRAHQMGIVHRDLKPENVLLMPRKGRPDFVKVLDFGIAKILDAPSLTGSQQIFGTPGYIAPEYIQSTDIDGRADLYSLGVILYEMVTGKLPFDYQYPGDLLVKHVTEAPVPPRERLPSIAPAVEGLLLRCLAKAPEDRFRDAYHFIDEVRRVRATLVPDDAWESSRDSTQPPPPDPESVEQLQGVGGKARSAEPSVTIARRSLRRSTLPPPASPRAPTPVVPAHPTGSADRVTLEYGSAPPLPPLARELGTPVEPMESREEPAEPAEAEPERPSLVGEDCHRARVVSLRHALVAVARTTPIALEVGAAMDRAEALLEELEKASAFAAEGQRALEQVGNRARDVRATLGSGLDEIAGLLSKARGAHDEQEQRRDEAERKLEELRRRPGVAGHELDAARERLADCEAQAKATARRCVDLGSQLTELQMRLEAENEKLEAQMDRLVTASRSQMLRLDALALALGEPLDVVESFVARHRPDLVTSKPKRPSGRP